MFGAVLLHRNLLKPLAAIVLGAIVVVVGLVVTSAYRQDVGRLERTAHLLGNALEAELDQVRRTALDYGWWDGADAARRFGPERPWRERRLGAWLADQFGYAWTFVIDGEGRTVDADRGGEPREVAAEDILGPGLAELIAAARTGPDEKPRALGGVLPARGQPHLVGVSAISPDISGPHARAADGGAVLVVTRAIDADLLASIAATYLIQDLRLVPATAAPPRASLPLESVDGRVLAHVAWGGPRMLGDVLPPLVVGLIAVALFSLVAMRETGRAARGIAEGERRLRDFADSASDWLWETDEALRITYLSERFEEVTGLDPASLLGRTWTDLRITDAEVDSLWRQHRDDVAAHRPFRDLVYPFLDGNGRRRFAQVSGAPVHDAAGRFRGYRGTGRDNTARVEAESRIRHLAQHDALTDLPNRVLLMDRLHQAFARVRREGGMAAVLCLDLDGFKAINDSLGHAAGDRVLGQIARRLRETVREVDTVARIGGDEFVVVQTAIEARDAPAVLAHRLLARLCEPWVVDGEEVRTGAGIGIACFPEDGATPEDVLRHADIALYHAKEAGIGQTVFFRPGMTLPQRSPTRRHEPL